MITTDILPLQRIQEEQVAASGQKLKGTQSIGKLPHLRLPCNNVNNWSCLIEGPYNPNTATSPSIACIHTVQYVIMIYLSDQVMLVAL